MEIREASVEDWDDIFPIFSTIVEAGESYALPLGLTSEEARPWWMQSPPGRTVVAFDDVSLLGTAKMGPNRPGRGSHIATASFMVNPEFERQGVGHELASTLSSGPAQRVTSAFSSTRSSNPTSPRFTRGRSSDSVF